MNLIILTLTKKRSKKQQYTEPTTIFKQAALHLKTKLKKARFNCKLIARKLQNTTLKQPIEI